MSAACAACTAPLDDGQRFCIACGTPASDFAVPAPAMRPFAEQPYGVFHACRTCGGEGAMLPRTQMFCPGCRWLRPLAPGHRIPTDAFLWSFDAQAMSTLQRMGPLKTAAEALSRKVGRPWLEASVNGIRLAPDQLPDIFDAAIDVGRSLGLRRLPEIYVSGEQMWDCMTLGSEEQPFIVVGSILANFRGADLRFVLGREMGRVLAGHTMWKTVLQFMSGKGGASRTIMGHGALQMLNPAKLIESAIDAPLMAWSRHAEITADRAGLLATGDHEAARRVLIQTALRSFPIYARLNMATLARDVAVIDRRQSALSEWTMSSTPYLGPRLKLLEEYAGSETLTGWRRFIDYYRADEAAALAPPPEPDMVRLACPVCDTGIRVRRTALEDTPHAKLRCAQPACGALLEIGPRAPSRAPAARSARPPASFSLPCPACAGTVIVPARALHGDAAVDVRCPGARCGKVLRLRPPAPIGSPATPLAGRPEEMVE